MKMSNTYPDSIQEFANKVIKGLEETHFFENTFKEPLTINQKQKAFDVLCENRFQNFIKGEELTFKDEMEVKIVVSDIMSTLSIDKLKELKLIDTIEDENGKEIIFLTAEGKEVIKYLDKGSDLEKYINERKYFS